MLERDRRSATGVPPSGSSWLTPTRRNAADGHDAATAREKRTTPGSEGMFLSIESLVPLAVRWKLPPSSAVAALSDAEVTLLAAALMTCWTLPMVCVSRQSSAP